jgi:NADPH2:quinone reductase
MKAMTARMLMRIGCVVQPGQTLLIHAAAGGVGQLLSSWCRHIGATIIGTVGSSGKAEIAQACGVRHVINYQTEDFVERVGKITDGNGVSVIFDSVGSETFTRSLECLSYKGLIVSYGQSSGPPPPISLSRLAEKSITVARPILFHYIRTASELDAMVREVFDAFVSGVIQPINPMELPLCRAAEAHEVLEGRRSPGGIVLRP